MWHLYILTTVNLLEVSFFPNSILKLVLYLLLKTIKLFALILKLFKIYTFDYCSWWIALSFISDSTVTKLDFDLEPEPPPAPPRDSSLGEIDESVRDLDTPGQVRHFKPCIIPFHQINYHLQHHGNLPAVASLGFPCGSDGKESACNVGDWDWIPG